ncbi:hypothetical protein WJX72_003471 [[Myrmecia] bisecta]|uniref:Phosphatidylinositol N-acetylglucosaminyltransferase subunit C n=1 Tax=[Myrmecia] bisecta TaxID=41462 RepID=A0AAW1PSR7_9CHLO
MEQVLQKQEEEEAFAAEAKLWNVLLVKRCVSFKGRLGSILYHRPAASASYFDLACLRLPNTGHLANQREAELDPSAAAAAAAAATPAWRKVLYEKQPYPDNHTDASFLAALVVNARVPRRDYWQIVRDSSVVVQQVSTVAAAVAVSVHLYEDLVDVHALLLMIIGVTLLGCLLCLAAGRQLPGGSLRRACRQCALLTTGVYLMSPLLQTLTLSISSDTIVALSCCLLAIHLFFHDYNFVHGVTDSLTGSLSLGAAVFASVLIASRLQSHLHVFVQVLFSLQMYLMSPYKFKAKINGPWDEAVPKIDMHVTASRSARNGTNR